METPQSLRDSSPRSGAKQFTVPYREGGNRRLSEGFPIIMNITKDEHQHFCYAKTNLSDFPINLSVQYARPYQQTATTTYNLLPII